MHEKIQDFLDRHNLEPKKENARSYIFDCPACGSSERLYIEKSNGRSVCFRHKTPECPTVKSSLAKVLSLISEVPYETVKGELADEVSVVPGEKLEISEPEIEKEYTFTIPIQPILEKDLPFDMKPISDPFSKEGLDYLEGRGLHVAQLEHLRVAYSLYLRRVIFPVMQNNCIYGWQGRSIDKEEKLRMYNLPGEWKAKTLMFYDTTKVSPHIIVAEGAVSALKFGNVGGYVATMGKTISEVQVRMIIESDKKDIYLALDPDAIAEMEDLTHKILTQTNNTVNIYLIKVPGHREDFGDCTYQECHEAFLEAQKLDFNCFALYAYAMEKE